MSGLIWLYIVGGLLALIGAWTIVRGIATGWMAFIGIVNDLISTLKDAAEVARAYREDVQILKQIAQTAVPNFGNEPESIIPQQPTAPATMPAPYWGRFAVKPDEPEAPLESVRDVDLTPTESDLMEQERQEAAGDFEAQERMKAATREADQARLKELADLSGEGQ